MAHRVKGAEVDPILERNIVEEAYGKLRKWETIGGRKNLRKNASLWEFVISWKGKKPGREAIKEGLRLLLEIRKKTKVMVGVDKPRVEVGGIITGRNYYMFLHEGEANTHLHILVVPRDIYGKKVNLKPALYREIVKGFLPKEDYERMVKAKRKLGAYPLWAIRKIEERRGKEFAREFVKLCRQRGITQKEFVGIVQEGEEEEVYKNLKEVKEKLEKVKRRKKRKGPGLG